MTGFFPDIDPSNHIHTTEDTIYNPDVATLNTLQDFINHSWSTGCSSDPGDFVLTENGDGTVDITGGVAVLRSSESPTAELKAYNIEGVTGMTFLDEKSNFILVDYNGGAPVLISSPNLSDVIGVITKTIVYVVNRLGNDLNIIDVRAFNVDFIRKNSIKDFKVNGFEYVTGNIISDEGDRKLAITAGEYYALNQPVTVGALDTTATGTFEYIYRDGANGWTRIASQTQIDNQNYDDGSGTLAYVGNNKFAVHYVYAVLNTPSHYKVVYGREVHNNLATAIDEEVITFLPSDLDADSTAVFIGRIVVAQNTSVFQRIQSPFIRVLTGTVANDHNELSGIQGGKLGQYNHLNNAEKDHAVIETANLANSTLGYTGGELTSITYADTVDITNNTKVLNYVGGVLQSIVHTFDYLNQTWTVTTTLSYTAGVLTNKSTTIGKV